MKKKQTQTTPAAKPDVEVLEQATRRRFSASYKLKIVQEADRLSGTGQIGAMLRREGLYSSQLAKRRKLRDKGALSGLSPVKRGPKAIEPNPLSGELETLRRENKRLVKKLQKAEMLIELQKKVAALPSESFGSQEDARLFLTTFFNWYNHDHRHSGINMMTPAAVHYGLADSLLVGRQVKETAGRD